MESSTLENIVQQQAELLKCMQEQLKQIAQCQPASSINVPWPSAIDIKTKDPEDAFKSFHASWKDYNRATQMDTWPKEQEYRKVSVLFSAIGEEALKKYANFGLMEADKEKLSCTEILDIMKTKMVPKKNIIYNRYIFWCRNQMLEEQFDLFFADLTTLIEDCDYNDFKDEMLRDKIVLGIRDMAVKKDLLKKENLTLKEAIDLCRAAEVTNEHIKEFYTNTEVKKIEEKKIKKGKCRFCGDTHIYKKEVCPAWGTTCVNCKGRNHLEKVCKKKKQIKEVKDNTKMKNENLQQESDTDDEYFINKIISDKNKNLAECTLEYKVNKQWKSTVCLLDTAADACIIGLLNAEKMFSKEIVQKKMRPSSKTLFGFGGNNVMVHGEMDITLKTNISGHKYKYTLTFQVVHCTHIPLLSCKACTEMGLVKFCKEVRFEQSQETQDILNKYNTVFEGNGRFSGEVKLEVSEEVPPVIQKARRVPVALWPNLKEEIRRLEKENIISKEENHTDWAFDAVFFISARPADEDKGIYVIAGCERRPLGMCNGLFYIGLPGKGLLCSAKLPDTVLFGAEVGEFGAEGLKITPEVPMKKWTVRYKGPMKFQNDPSQVVEVDFEGTWTASSDHFDFDSDLHPPAVIRSIAREPWTREYFEGLKTAHQSHYEQFGDLHCKFTIDGEPHNLTLPSFRDHSFGAQRDWSLMHRYAFHHIFLANGVKASVGVICQPSTASSFEVGVVALPTGEVLPVKWVDLKLYQHGEGGEAPRDYGFSFQAGDEEYHVQVLVEYEAVHFVSSEWEARMVERFCRFTVNGAPGRGVSEFHYRHRGGRARSAKENDPQWFRTMRHPSSVTRYEDE